MESSAMWDDLEGELTKYVDAVSTVESIPPRDLSEPSDTMSVSAVVEADLLVLKSKTGSASGFEKFFETLPDSLKNFLNIEPIVDGSGTVFARLTLIDECVDHSVNTKIYKPYNSVKFIPKLSDPTKIDEFNMVAQNIQYYETLLGVDKDFTMEVEAKDDTENGFSALISKDLLPVQYETMGRLLPTSFPIVMLYITGISGETEECVRVDFEPVGVEVSDSSPLRLAYELSDKYQYIRSTAFDFPYYCEDCSAYSRIVLKADSTVFFTCTSCGDIQSLEKSTVEEYLIHNQTPFVDLRKELPQQASAFTGKMFDSELIDTQEPIKTQHSYSGNSNEMYLEFTDTDITIYEQVNNSLQWEFCLSEVKESKLGETDLLGSCGMCGTTLGKNEKSTTMLVNLFIYNPKTDMTFRPSNSNWPLCEDCFKEVQTDVQSAVNAHAEEVLSHRI